MLVDDKGNRVARSLLGLAAGLDPTLGLSRVRHILVPQPTTRCAFSRQIRHGKEGRKGRGGGRAVSRVASTFQRSNRRTTNDLRLSLKVLETLQARTRGVMFSILLYEETAGVAANKNTSYPENMVQSNNISIL